MMKGIGKAIGAAVLAGSLLTACNISPAYYKYQSVRGLAWQLTDTLHFEVSLPDTGRADLAVWLEIRHRGDYPYRNLSVRMARQTWTTLPPDTVCQTDTLRLTLTDTEGRWTGEGLANIFQCTFEAGKIHTTTPAVLHFDITPALPDSLLKGISDIGIRLEHISASDAPAPHQSAETQKAES